MGQERQSIVRGRVWREEGRAQAHVAVCAACGARSGRRKGVVDRLQVPQGGRSLCQSVYFGLCRLVTCASCCCTTRRTRTASSRSSTTSTSSTCACYSIRSTHSTRQSNRISLTPKSRACPNESCLDREREK